LFASNEIVLGLIFAAILAAAMSSADSMLVNASSAIVYDLGGDIFDRHDEDLTLYVRITTLLIGALVAVLTLNPPGLILTIVILAVSLFAGAFFAPVMFGLCFEDRSDPAAVASMITGVLTVFVVHPETGLLLDGLSSPAAGIVGVAVSAVAFFLVRLVGEPTRSGEPIQSD